MFDIRVGASDPDGDITDVQIFINNIEVVRLNSGLCVYTVSTELFSSGIYAIRAVAKDNGGLTASDEIEIRVDV